jgi:transposase InsO family protein
MGRWFHLYLILDLYSRKIVGAEVHDSDDADHAVHLVRRRAWHQPTWRWYVVPALAAVGATVVALRADVNQPAVAPTLFDAAIRKVEQGRARAPSVEPTQVAAVTDGDGAALPDDEETIDHAAGGDVD